MNGNGNGNNNLIELLNQLNDLKLKHTKLLVVCREMLESIETYGDRMHTKTDWEQRFRKAIEG